MKIAFCLVAISISGVLSASIDSHHPLSDEFIDFINSQQSTWTAGRNFDEKTPVSHIRGLLGALESPGARDMLTVRQHSEDVEIPDTFDARENWPECKIIRVIKDQSACGSCWAVAAASAMSDRICINSNGTKQIYVSDEDLLSCCGYGCGFGCSGGFPIAAWYYWQEEGLSSGGPYDSTTGCKSYSMLPCEHHSTGDRPQCSSYDFETPECRKKCDSGSSLDYKSDKTYGQSPYTVAGSDLVKQIQLEILKNGPAEASFTVFEDFLSYKSGVYQQVAGDVAGGHAVRLLGWGVEKGTPYWLVANSWNEDWGDNGLFKIIRGRDECGFESEIVASLPRK